jgi:hypothetical protein
VLAGITQATGDALVMAMAKDPSQRYQSYDEFIMALTASRSQLLINHFRNQRDTDTSKPASGGRSWWRK